MKDENSQLPGKERTLGPRYSGVKMWQWLPTTAAPMQEGMGHPAPSELGRRTGPEPLLTLPRTDAEPALPWHLVMPVMPTSTLGMQ